MRLHYNLLPRMIYYVRNCDIFWLLDCLHNFASTLQPLSFLVQGTLCGLFVLHHHWRITLMRRRILIGFLWVNISQRSKIQPEKFRNLESCFRINRTQLGQDRLRPRSFFSHIMVVPSKPSQLVVLRACLSRLSFKPIRNNFNLRLSSTTAPSSSNFSK